MAMTTMSERSRRQLLIGLMPADSLQLSRRRCSWARNRAAGCGQARDAQSQPALEAHRSGQVRGCPPDHRPDTFACAAAQPKVPV